MQNTFRRALTGAVAALASAFAASSASAMIIDLEAPKGDFGPTYSQDGFTFTNSYGTSDSYSNWIVLKDPGNNANGSNATIFAGAANSSNTLTNNASQPFSFGQIGLADGFNHAGDHGSILFKFHHVGGLVTTSTVSLSGIQALNIFNFSESNLTSVVFTPLTTDGPWIQFDLVGVDVGAGSVPEPATWALMILGFGGAGAALRRRRTVVAA